VLMSGVLGMVTYILVNGLSGLLEEHEAAREEAEAERDQAALTPDPGPVSRGRATGELALKTGKAAFFSFLYLEVLDASFSFDGVIGAFAITSDPIIIAIGLGVGAMYIRSLTVYLVRKGTLADYVYLEHGALWAIGSLAVLLLLTIRYEIPEVVTGLIGVGFVILHMAGNLQVFIGQSKLNDYGAMLHGPLAELTWLLRIILIVALILHVTMFVQLTQRSAAARPVGYQKKTPQVSTLASRTMKWGGVLLLVFIVFHILHFTTETIDPGGWRGMSDVHGNRDVYGNMVASFRIWWVSLFYIVAMIVLGLHLYHGAWSSVRTLGHAKASPHPLHRRIALAVAVIVWLGFTLVPLGVIVGVIR